MPFTFNFAGNSSRGSPKNSEAFRGCNRQGLSESFKGDSGVLIHISGRFRVTQKDLGSFQRTS